jgi:DNA-binding NarL/FixJ family response regulator
VVRILIADGHEVVRTGLQTILNAHVGWEVAAVAGDGVEAIEKARETTPDIAIIEYCLPRLNGIEVARQIREQLPRTEVLIFTTQENEALVGDALRAGARGYLMKSDSSRLLIAAIEALVAHNTFFTGRVSEALLRSFATGRQGYEGSALTRRERQIVQLIAEGHMNKDIARLLNIGLKTVETHRSAVMTKLDLSSPAALVRYAIRNKLVEP